MFLLRLQEVGIDGNSERTAESSAALDSIDPPVSFSIDDDPFNDDFFQRSFSSSSAPATPGSPQNQEPFGFEDPFAEISSAGTDPFSSTTTPPVIGEALSNPPYLRPPVCDEDPFAAISSAQIPSPVVSTTSSRDPFADNDTARSTTVTSGAAFEGFGSDFAAFPTANETLPPQDQATSFSFDSDFQSEPQLQVAATESSLPSQAPSSVSFEANLFEPQSIVTSTAPNSSFSFDVEPQNTVVTSSPPAQTETSSSSFEANFPESQNATTAPASQLSNSTFSFEAAFPSEPQNTVSQTQPTSSIFEANFSEPQIASTSAASTEVPQSSNSLFETDFFQSNTTSVPSSSQPPFSFEAEPTTTSAPPKGGSLISAPPSKRRQPRVSPPQPQTTSSMFEASFPEPQEMASTSTAPKQAPQSSNSSFEVNFSQSNTATTLAPPSQALFSSAAKAQTTSAPAKGLIAAPPKQQQPRASPSGSRFRPKPKASFGEAHFPPPNTSQETGNNTSTQFSPGSISNSANFSTDTESTLQLTNPLYQSQTANSSFQTEPSTANAVSATGGSSKTPDLSWGEGIFSPQQASIQPVGPQFTPYPQAPMPQQPVNAYPNNAMYQYPVQNPAMAQGLVQNPAMAQGLVQNPAMGQGLVQNPAMAQGLVQNPAMGQGPTAMAQFPVQNPPMSQGLVQNPAMGQGLVQNPAMGLIPGQNPPAMVNFQPPMQPTGIYSPPQAHGGNMTNNPFAGDFSSPPYAIHSSTPQSSPQPPPSAQPLPPVYDGPDVFAELLPLALPKKDEAGEPPVPVVPTTVSEETPKTTEPKPKRPSLNELYSQKHRQEMLQPTKVEEINKLSAVKEQSSADPFGSPVADAGSNAQPSFDDNFNSGGNASSDSPWVPF